ncbi:iron chelate uptake ABC transporter family permease subunit [Microbacterium sp. NPDC090003]|uniref:iron chelate uptake ABC transporter family permease subunit n=1 Tax=Microbacterium sp. NPDC090003 TaxID=3364203 RepID=UPI0037FE01FB
MTSTTSLPSADLGTTAGTRHFGARRTVGFALIALALSATVLLSLSIGAREVALPLVWDALRGAGSDADAATALALRIPRTVLGLLVGAALGVAGALIQAVTRNPLADPGILGVNSGAAFAVAIAVGVFGLTAPPAFLWFAFGGALITTIVVYLIGSAGRGSVSPARITLAGVAIGAVLSGITSAMLLANPRGFNAMRAWEAGIIADRGWEVVLVAGPYLAVGLVLALLLGRPLNAVALGDDLARSLGSSVLRTRILSIVAITLLCGTATAMAGPIAFIGLMIPHVARWIVGPDQRWILAYSALLAPILLLASDVLGRVVLRPGELPVGIVTAFVGAPVLIVLVRKQRASAL